MVTTTQIDSWKQEYGSIYKANDIIFRRLTRSEYISLLTQQQTNPINFDYEVAVTKMCVLGGLEEGQLENEPGLSTVLCEQILMKSGFQQIEVEEL